MIRIGTRALVSLAFLPAGAVEGAAGALELKETIPVQVRAWGEGVFLYSGRTAHSPRPEFSATPTDL